MSFVGFGVMFSQVSALPLRHTGIGIDKTKPGLCRRAPREDMQIAGNLSKT